MVGVVFFAVANEWVGRISAMMFGVTPEEAKATFFRVFQQYRLALVVLNIVPYIALRFTAG